MSKVKYAINIEDGRVVLANQETMRQPKYREIAEETAIAIEKGEVEAGNVVKELMFGKRKAPLPAGVKVNENVRRLQFPDPDAEQPAENTEGDQPPAIEPEQPETPTTEEPVTPEQPETPTTEEPVTPEQPETPSPEPSVGAGTVNTDTSMVDGKTLPELKVMAAELKVPGFNKMKAGELKAAILGIAK